MPSAKKLYEAVQRGDIKFSELNSEGVKAIQPYVRRNSLLPTAKPKSNTLPTQRNLKEERLYTAVQTGKIKYDELNEAGKKVVAKYSITPANAADLRKYDTNMQVQPSATQSVMTQYDGVMPGTLGRLNKQFKAGFAEGALFGKGGDLYAKEPSSTVEKIARVAGNLGGFGAVSVATGGFGASALKLPIQNALLRTVAREGIAGGIYGTAEGLANRQTGTDLVKNIATRSAEFGGIGAIGHGIGVGARNLMQRVRPGTTVEKAEELAKTTFDVAENADEFNGRVNQRAKPDFTVDQFGNVNAGEPLLMLPAPKQAATIKTALPQRQYRIVTPEQQARQEWEKAFEQVTNYIKHNDLLAAYPPGTKVEDAIVDVSKKLGIDLPKLADNYEKAAGIKTGDLLKRLGERGRMGRVAGVYPEAKLPKRNPNILKPTELELPKVDYSLGKGQKETPFARPVQMKANPLEDFVPPPYYEETIGVKPKETVNKQGIDMTQWKDKAPPLLARETMERNMEDIAGKDAPEVIRTYIEPVKQSEANRIRWLNKERQDIASLGIKGKSKESELLQKYGEGIITLGELKQATPEWQKIVKANEVLRQKYDSYLDEINKALTRNGYDPIPKRKDYFAHFQEVSDVLERFGIPVRDNALPTDINGLTDNFKPGKNFFAHALQRKGNKTTFDAIQGIDRYLEGASKLIHHTDNIQRLREFEKQIRTQFEGTDHLANFVTNLSEYTNVLAGKKTRADRAAESYVGRKIYGAVDRLRKQVGANMIGGNISSALTNFIPLTQSLATTNKKAFVQGMLETVANTFKNDGFVDKSDFLTRRIGSDKLVMNLWDKAGQKAGWLFKSIDNFVAQTVVRSKYLEGIQNGLSPQDALKRADYWAARAMADRSLASMPLLFNSRVLAPFTQFQLEVNNQLSFIFKDIPRNFDKKGAAAALAQLFVYGYIFNNLYEQAVGRRPAFDPIYVALQAYEDYTNPNKTTTDANKRTIRNVANQLPFTSLIEGGRIPMGSALPNPIAVAKGESTWGAEGEKAVTNLILPFGGNQAKKTIQGIKALNQQAVYDKDGNQLMYPVTPTKANIVRGVLFGKSSFPETREYYDNNRRPLGEKQTIQFNYAVDSMGYSPQDAYSLFLLQRQMDDIKEKAKELQEQGKLTPDKMANLQAESLKVTSQIKNIIDKYQK